MIVNPNSGKSKALKIYEKYAAPLFKDCDINADVWGKFYHYSEPYFIIGIRSTDINHLNRYTPKCNYLCLYFKYVRNSKTLAESCIFMPLLAVTQKPKEPTEILNNYDLFHVNG